MDEKSNKFPKHGFLILFLSFLLLLVLFPFASYLRISSYLIRACFSLILIFSLYLFSYNRYVFTAGIVLFIPSIIFEWLSVSDPNILFAFLTHVFNLLFVGYSIAVLCILVFSQTKISSDTIFGTVCVYLLLGVFFSQIYNLIDLFSSSAFAGEMTSSKEEDLLYYSFVTLTTLGYGEIIPKSLPAKFLSIIEAVCGQLYIATAIARTIGISIKKEHS